MRFLVCLALVGCAPAVTPSGGGPDAVAGDGASPGGDTRYQRYRGTLASAGPVSFGGMGYCDYRVTLRDISLDAVLLDRLELAQLVVVDERVEEAIMCQYPPAPPNVQVFEHRGPAEPIQSDRVAPAMTGASGNDPATELRATITGIANAPALDAVWHRTDQPPPLDWTVMASGIALNAVPCIAGTVSCVGRVLDGQLYVCNADGRTLTADKHCEAGCADGTSCR